MLLLMTPVPNASLTEGHHPRPTRRQEMHPTFAYPPIYWNIFWQQWSRQKQRRSTSSSLGLTRYSDIIHKNKLHLPTNSRPFKNAPKVCHDCKPVKTQLSNWPFIRQQQFNSFMYNLHIICNNHHGRAMSLTFGQNKSAFLIHALVQQSTTWSSQTLVIPARSTLLTVHQMPEPQYWLCDVTVHRSLKITLNARATPFAPLNKDTKKLQHHFLLHLNANLRLLSARIPSTDAEIINQSIHCGSNHHFYAVSIQQLDANTCWAELKDEDLPPLQNSRATYWILMIHVDHLSLLKKVELQPTCKFCMPILLKSHFSSSRNHTYFQITPTASLQFNNATIHFKQQQTTKLT